MGCGCFPGVTKGKKQKINKQEVRVCASWITPERESYCGWGRRGAGAGGPGVQGVAWGWYVPDRGGGDSGVELMPALLRLRWFLETHSTEH